MRRVLLLPRAVGKSRAAIIAGNVVDVHASHLRQSKGNDRIAPGGVQTVVPAGAGRILQNLALQNRANSSSLCARKCFCGARLILSFASFPP
jgi:hypothetical protein